MKIYIHRHEFKVEFIDGEDKKMRSDDGCYSLGLTEYFASTINIRRGMDKVTTRETVIHELVHAFLFVFGYTVDDEESMCDFFGAQGDSIIRMADYIMEKWSEFE